MRRIAIALLLGTTFSWVGPARADIYKVVGPNGAVTFTDNINLLPPERRAAIIKKREEAEQKRKELEATLSKQDIARRGAEEARHQELQKSSEDAERKKRIDELDALLKTYEDARKKREAAKSKWVKMMANARTRLARALADFQAAQEKYNQLATLADFALLPGQAEQRDKAREAVDRAAAEVEEAAQEVDWNLPEKARVEGIPPGWLRE